MKSVSVVFVSILLACTAVGTSVAAGDRPGIVNIINFIRQTEPRSEEITDEVLYQTVAEQVKQLNDYRLPATFLLQYDALINPKYQALLKDGLYEGSEIGGWWEITQPHVEAAGMVWRGRFPWDWHADVGFSPGYTPVEREKLVDVYMEKFREIFGRYPSSVGSWFIDAHTLGYMYDKYGITASCNCKDQIGTDGYTLWGGYWNQAYYPSRLNAYMPAQTEHGQIPVPVFRMLGSDPIYQYDSGVGGRVQSVISLEPVYPHGGGSSQWVEWFFRSMFDEPCLAFAYVQAGQENSFTWDAMKKGLGFQIPILSELSDQGRIRVETLGESGRWFRERFPVTPATAVTALTDWKGEGRKTVWFNSRFYRANLLWEGASFRFRDIHAFDQDYESYYLKNVLRSSQCIYTTLPVVDGCMWSGAQCTAGLRVKTGTKKGGLKEVSSGDPVVEEKGNELLVKTPLNGGEAMLTVWFREDEIEITCESGQKGFVWEMELTADASAELPFVSFSDNIIKARLGEFYYDIPCSSPIEDCRQREGDAVFRIKPFGKKTVFQLFCGAK